MKNINSVISDPTVKAEVNRLLFGVDSAFDVSSRLQNNIDLFEWMLRNKVYPNFVGRYILGENCLTKEEIGYLHGRGCSIAPIFRYESNKSSNAEGERCASFAIAAARKLGIRSETALYLELPADEGVSSEFLRGVANEMLIAGYTPAFRANTDSAYGFDREFGRGTQSAPEIFRKCLIWATAPILEEYDGMTTSHLIHPDNWKPFAPSAIKRNEIAIWQYGKECHPIEDERGRNTAFNLSLVRNEDIIIKKMC